MKILHTSDWHLGKTVSGQFMLEDQRYFIEQIFLPALDLHKPDVIVLAGDIYDRSIAPTAAIELFEKTLYAVAERNIPLIAISGNHDSAERIIPGSKLMRSAGIYLANSIDDFFSPIDITAADGSSARFFTLPFVDISAVKNFTSCDDLRTVGEAYSELFKMNCDKLTDDRPNILITHCTVTGVTTCESESQIYIGGAQQISSDIFSPFDFTCLGHIHSHQKTGGSGAYSGAPLRYSFDTNERDKCMLLIDTENFADITRIPIKPLHEMRTVSGSFEKLLSVDDNATEDYVFAIVTDDKLIYEPMSRLREKYPNILGLRQTYLSALSGMSDSRSDIRSRMSSHSITDSEIFISFMRDICMTEPTDEDMNLFENICKNAEDECEGL